MIKAHNLCNFNIVKCKRMKTLILFMSFFCMVTVSYAQKQLISYEDLKYLLENTPDKADTFLTDRGYTLVKTHHKTHKRRYMISMPDGTKSAIELRTDGKRNYVEIDTDNISQYNTIHNSIADFLQASTNNSDKLIYTVTDLGTINVTVSDTMPYSRNRKDYDIHLVANTNVTNFN